MVNVITAVVSIHGAYFPVNSLWTSTVMLFKTLDNVDPSVPLILFTDDNFSPTCTIVEMDELGCIGIKHSASPHKLTCLIKKSVFEFRLKNIKEM